MFAPLFTVTVGAPQTQRRLSFIYVIVVLESSCNPPLWSHHHDICFALRSCPPQWTTGGLSFPLHLGCHTFRSSPHHRHLFVQPLFFLTNRICWLNLGVYWNSFFPPYVWNFNYGTENLSHPSTPSPLLYITAPHKNPAFSFFWFFLFLTGPCLWSPGLASSFY